MTRSVVLVVFVVVPLMATAGSSDQAQTVTALPSPLGLADVVRVASERRAEIMAARARVRAGEARPDIVSALEDPMVSPSLDHLPFMLGGADVSVTIEQRIPLSGIRRHRRTSALADLDRVRTDVNRTTLDVGLQAANAFLMLTLLVLPAAYAMWRRHQVRVAMAVPLPDDAATTSEGSV